MIDRPPVLARGTEVTFRDHQGERRAATWLTVWSGHDPMVNLMIDGRPTNLAWGRDISEVEVV